MASAFQLSIVAPDRTVVETQVTSLVAPGYEGYLGVLAGHEASLVALRAGLVEFTDTSNLGHCVALGGGFMEISESKVIILADDAKLADEIMVAEEEKLMDEARKALRGENSSVTIDEAQHVIERAMTRIKAARQSN